MFVGSSKCEGSGGDLCEGNERRSTYFSTGYAVTVCEALREGCTGVGDVFAEAATCKSDFGVLCHHYFAVVIVNFEMKNFDSTCKIEFIYYLKSEGSSLYPLIVDLTCMTQHPHRRKARLNFTPTIFPSSTNIHKSQTQPKIMPSEAQEKQASAAQARQVIDVFQEIATLLVNTNPPYFFTHKHP